MDRQDFDLSRAEGDRPAQPDEPQRRARGATPRRTRTKCGASTPRRVLRADRSPEEPRAPTRRVDRGVAEPAREPGAPREPLRVGEDALPGSPRAARVRRATASPARPRSSPTTSATATSRSTASTIGLPLVQRSLSLLDSLGARQAMDYPCLDLCFAIAEARRELERGRELGHRGARSRKRVRPQRRRQELALPAGRDLHEMGRARPPTITTRRWRTTTRLPRAEALPPSDQPDGDDQPEGMMKRARTPRMAPRFAGPRRAAGRGLRRRGTFPADARRDPPRRPRRPRRGSRRSRRGPRRLRHRLELPQPGWLDFDRAHSGDRFERLQAQPPARLRRADRDAARSLDRGDVSVLAGPSRRAPRRKLG